MKRITYSLITLFLLSAGLSIVSLSCNKEASAQPDTTISTLGFITYMNNNNGVMEYWKCNYDGTGKTRINMPSPPDNFQLTGDFRISPDGRKLFFTCLKGTNNAVVRLYSANIDGTNLILIDEGSGLGNLTQAL